MPDGRSARDPGALLSGNSWDVHELRRTGGGRCQVVAEPAVLAGAEFGAQRTAEADSGLRFVGQASPQKESVVQVGGRARRARPRDPLLPLPGVPRSARRRAGRRSRRRPIGVGRRARLATGPRGGRPASCCVLGGRPALKATTREARVRRAGYRLITTPRPRGRCSPHPTTIRASAPAKTTANTRGRLVNCSRMFGTTPSATAVLAAVTIVPPPSRDSASRLKCPSHLMPPNSSVGMRSSGSALRAIPLYGRAFHACRGRFLTAPTCCPRQPDRRQTRDSTSS